MGRTARIIADGYPHHIVHRGHNRQVVFRDNYDRDTFIFMLSHYLGRSNCKLMAYCLMPNHVHLILQPDTRDDLVEIMHRISFRYAQYFNATTDRKGALWESRYFSSVIKDDTYLWRAAKYICLNPVRAGIVDNPCDYPWSSARDLLLGAKGPLHLDNWIKDTQRSDFREMILEETEIRAIGYLLKRGLPYGSPHSL